MKEVKILSLSSSEIDERIIDAIIDITNSEVHQWIKNDKGGLDLMIVVSDECII